jgi:hypothetical protein
MNANGAAVVAWTDNLSGTAGNLEQASASVRAATGGTWTAPQVMRPGDDDSDRDPAVAMSGTGQAFVGWQQSDGGNDFYLSLWMRQYTSGAGWAPAALFETYDAQSAYDVSLSANTAGNAIGTYIEVSSSNPATIQLWSRSYTPAGGFAAPIKAADGNNINILVPPSVVLDDTGVATAAWAFQATAGFEVYTSRLGPTNTAWPTSLAMETDDVAKSSDITTPIVKSDTAGNVTLIWRKTTNGTRFDVASRRFAQGIWGTATLLDTPGTDSVDFPALGVGTSGTAVAAWYYDTALDVYANVFR